MKIYLDDVREAPAGWIRAFWPDEVIAHLQSGGVTEVSLDHDLGDDTRGTGYNVVLWIEEAVVVNQFVPPKIFIHSANPVGRDRMLRGIESINKAHAQRMEQSQRSIRTAFPQEAWQRALEKVRIRELNDAKYVKAGDPLVIDIQYQESEDDFPNC